MFCKDETKVERDVKYTIKYDQDKITIFVRNLKTGKNKTCEYNCPYDYYKGYSDEDIFEVMRLLEDFIQEVRKDG